MGLAYSNNSCRFSITADWRIGRRGTRDRFESARSRARTTGLLCGRWARGSGSVGPRTGSTSAAAAARVLVKREGRRVMNLEIDDFFDDFSLEVCVSCKLLWVSFIDFV